MRTAPEPNGDAFSNSVNALRAVPKSEAGAEEAKRPNRYWKTA